MSKKPILSQRVLEQHTLNRYERERRTRKYVVIGSIVVTILVLLLIAAAVLQIFVFEPNRAVATVNGTNISVAQVQSRMKLEFADLTYNYNQLASQVQQLQRSTNQNDAFLVQFYQQQLQQIGSRGTTEQVARNSLDALIDEILVRQEAQRRNISVNANEVQQEVEKSIGFFRSTLTPFPTYTPVTPEPTLTPSPTPLTATKSVTATKPITPSPTLVPLPTATQRLQPTSVSQAELQQGRERGAQFYTTLGYPATQFEHAYETNLLTKKVQDVMAKEVPTRTQHYQFNYVRFNTIETATQYSKLLASGQITFDLMITQSNTITQPAPIGSGSHRDWTSKASIESQFGNEVLAALEANPFNKATTIVTSSLTNGYYILLPLGREVRDLEASELQQAQQKNYADWLTAAKADANKVQRKFDPLTVMPKDLKTSIDQFQQSISASQGAGSGAQGGQ